ncbi:hypothetical protein ICL16_16470 [Iningainema sp. BLCCT55]|uniref:Trypsin-co-occurring domain-containing protein n=2 Tax=Iningainema TaxID=1932705 RepID=A0A8J6XTL7_9CYAN|nr:hypothetical protein [Iningainema tapete BLCC-T55]
MSEVQRLIVKQDDQEYEIYVESKTAADLPEEEEPGYRDVLPTVNIQEFHDKLRGYTRLALGAFKNLPEAEEVTIKFGIKLGGKVGIPILVEGSSEGNFEIEVKCKFPDKHQNLGGSSNR